jgi:Leucine-rich repeat (LRR) protein
VVGAGSTAQEKTAEFERRLCEAMVRKYDYLELFGADIPRESQRHALSVAYVSLNLSKDDGDDEEEEEEEEEEAESAEDSSSLAAISETSARLEKEESFVGARPVDEVFDRLSPSTGRLLIRGVAGGGKSTLLRWASIQAAKFNLENHDLSVDVGSLAAIVANSAIASRAIPQQNETCPSGSDPVAQAAPQQHGDDESETDQTPDLVNWRTKIPFLIRLRDCPDGSLPRPKELPALIAKELPDPPPEWIDQVLTSGRALLLFDGVDEIPTDKRDLLAREIENLINAYPKNYCIVSTRPGAVDKGWLSKLNFFEARIEPMSPDDQDEFIDKWYSAVSAELRASARRAENLDRLAASLKQELRDTPSIGKLAIYPLLCAMICALYRERNQKLPETQAALCEDLCKILLHRRERETPDMKLVHLPPDYRKLDYEHKKYIVAELAKFMVENGLSSLDEPQADSLLESALKHFPDHAVAKPQEMRRALVERSGLLRPSGANRIDFLHNTLKEYLAAGRFVTDGKYKLLASHAEDDAWQPVILFAAALPTPGFASKLLQELLKGVRHGAKQERPEIAADKKEVTGLSKRNREFFVVRCRNAAFRLEPSLVTRVTRLASGLFPPNTIADAEALASLGDAIVSHLDPKFGLTTRQKVACIRALRLVGGPKAKGMIKKFTAGKSKSVLLELLVASAELETTIKLTNESLDLSSTSIRDLSPLKGQTAVHSLNLAYTNVADLSPLSGLRGLRSLNLAETSINDLAPVSSLKALQSLNLTGTEVRDFSPLAQLADLQILSIGRFWRHSPFRFHVPWLLSSNLAESPNDLERYDYDYFENGLMEGFQRFDFRHFRYFRDFQRHKSEQLGFLLKDASVEMREKLAPLASMFLPFDRPSEEIDARVFPPELLEHLSSHPNLMERLIDELHLGYRRHRLGPRAWFEWMEKELRLVSTRPKNVFRTALLAPLSKLKKLRVVDLSGLPAVDLSALSKLRCIEFLQLSGTFVMDLSPLRRLSGLRWLGLSNCPASDFSVLRGHKNLRGLDLNLTRIRDLQPLKNLSLLEVLSLAGTDVTDFSPLLNLSKLRFLVVDKNFRTERKSHVIQFRQLDELKRINRNLRINRIG